MRAHGAPSTLSGRASGRLQSFASGFMGITRAEALLWLVRAVPDDSGSFGNEGVLNDGGFSIGPGTCSRGAIWTGADGSGFRVASRRDASAFLSHALACLRSRCTPSLARDPGHSPHSTHLARLPDGRRIDPDDDESDGDDDLDGDASDGEPGQFKEEEDEPTTASNLQNLRRRVFG